MLHQRQINWFGGKRKKADFQILPALHGNICACLGKRAIREDLQQSWLCCPSPLCTSYPRKLGQTSIFSKQYAVVGLVARLVLALFALLILLNCYCSCSIALAPLLLLNCSCSSSIALALLLLPIALALFALLLCLICSCLFCSIALVNVWSHSLQLAIHFFKFLVISNFVYWNELVCPCQSVHASKQLAVAQSIVIILWEIWY